MRLALLLTLRGFLLAVLPALLIGETAEATAAVEVWASRLDARPECGCGPATILISIERDAFVVGEERHVTSRHLDVASLRARLAALKDERKDREHVILQVHDDVDHARVVAVIDAALGVELRALELFVGAGEAFTPTRWSLVFPD